MRWHITENKRRIAAENFEGHFDRLEMSGERVSGVIGYGVKEGEPCYTRQFSFPMFRIQPNNTHGSYQPACNIEPMRERRRRVGNALSGTAAGGSSANTFPMPSRHTPRAACGT